MQALPWDGHKQTIPIRCSLCRSKTQRSGKIFDMVSTSPGESTYFLQQHCDTQTHQKQLALKAAERALSDRRQEIECLGLQLHCPMIGPLSEIVPETMLWISWQGSSVQDFRQHTYYTEADGDATKCTIRHGKCLLKFRGASFEKSCPECMKRQPGQVFAEW